MKNFTQILAHKLLISQAPIKDFKTADLIDKFSYDKLLLNKLSRRKGTFYTNEQHAFKFGSQTNPKADTFSANAAGNQDTSVASYGFA